MKVVINACHGGFSLSKQATDMYCKTKGIDPGTWQERWGFYSQFSDRAIERNDPTLVDIVESLGDQANGACARLEIVDIPDDVKWHIAEYDGYEHVAEDHRTWR